MGPQIQHNILSLMHINIMGSRYMMMYWKERNFIPSFGGADSDSMKIWSCFGVLDIEGSILDLVGIDP